MGFNSENKGPIGDFPFIPTKNVKYKKNRGLSVSALEKKYQNKDHKPNYMKLEAVQAKHKNMFLIFFKIFFQERKNIQQH